MGGFHRRFFQIGPTVFKFLEDTLGGGATDTIWPFGADSNEAIDLMKKVGYVVVFPFLECGFYQTRCKMDSLMLTFSEVVRVFSARLSKLFWEEVSQKHRVVGLAFHLQKVCVCVCCT